MMQGQDGNTFPGAFYLDYGSNNINVLWGQTNIVRVDALLCDGHAIMDLVRPSSSNINNQTHVQFQDSLHEDRSVLNRIDQSSMNTQNSAPSQDLVVEDILLSLSVPGALLDPSLVERMSEPIVATQHSSEMNLGNNHLTNRPLSLQHINYSPLRQTIDLNIVCDKHGVDACLYTGTSLLKPGRADADPNTFINNFSNSDPLVISSGVSGYVVEENDSREGHSSGGSRLSCKRRAPEDGIRQFSVGESSRTGDLIVNIQENARRRLNSSEPISYHSNVQYSPHMGMVGIQTIPAMHHTSGASIRGHEGGAQTSSDVYQMPTAVGEAGNSQRNVQLGGYMNQQNFVPANFALCTARDAYAQLLVQPVVLSSFDYVQNRSSETGLAHLTPVLPSTCAPNSLERLQPLLTAVTLSRTGWLSSAYALNGGDDSLPADNSNYNARNGILPPGFERWNSEHMLTNINFVPGTNYPGSIASTPQNSYSSCTHPSLAPFWFPRGAELSSMPTESQTS